MKIINFGALSTVGQDVLLECLLDPGVERMLVAARGVGPKARAKLRELVVRGAGDLALFEADLCGFDAGFFARPFRRWARKRQTIAASPRFSRRR